MADEAQVDSPRVDLEFSEWQTIAPGARHKPAERAGKRIRLVEFTDAFVEPDWCHKAHVGYVLGGELEIAFENRTVRCAPGDGFVIRGGGGEKHKARALRSIVRFLLVEDV